MPEAAFLLNSLFARCEHQPGHPPDLAIYRLVREREQGSVAELERSISVLAREFDLSLSTVSHHVKELRQAGLIRCVKRGQTVYCEPDSAALEAIERFLGEVS